MKRLRLASLFAASLLVVPLLAAGAGAAPSVPSVDIVKVQGIIDPAVTSYVRGSVEAAERSGSAVILQIDSQGSYGDRALDLAEMIHGAEVPVVAWAGPSGARVAGGALFMLEASSFAVLAPGAGVGPAVPFDVATDAAGADPAGVSRDTTELRRLAGLRGAGIPALLHRALAVWAIAFELTQPGFGMAGIGGALGLLLSGYGLTVVPVHWFGFAMLLLGMGLPALDAVVKRLGVLTVAGTGLFAAGSVLAWHGISPAVDVSLWLIVLLTVGGVLLFGFGLTVALRARERVRTAQVGLVGLVGEARKDIDPEGAVYVKGTLWRARSSNGPIPAGTRVRIRGVDGLILRVEREQDQG